MRIRSIVMAALMASTLADAGRREPVMPPPAPALQAVSGDRTSGWLSQSRSEVLARNGMVATSQPLAAEAGLGILRAGGNAIDAAIATAAALNVVEPASAGVGGDALAIIWLAKEQRLIAMNAIGRAPAAATLPAYRAKGFKEMPLHGIHSATVPGAVDGWVALLKRAGTLPLGRVLEPAIHLAEDGFPISERIRNDWIYGAEVLSPDPESRRVYLPSGRIPETYQIFRNPDLGRTLRLIADGGRDAFYRGPVAQAIVKRSRELGGFFAMSDFAPSQVTWDTPITTRYRGVDVYEMPAPTQGMAVLEMLNIVEACAPKFGLDIAKLGPRSPDYFHLMVEAKKLAYTDLAFHDGDPAFSKVPTDRLISKSYAASLCDRIDMWRAAPIPPGGEAIGGTVYVATADREGNMVSFIYSIYDSFGSGITVPGYGFVLGDRGALFNLDPASPNVIAPTKRPFHTLLPGFLMKDGRPLMAFGLMGGGQQAQGHAQVLIDMLDFGANVQSASDAARFTHVQARNRLALESQLYRLVGAELAQRGHVVETANGENMGGFQAIRFEPEHGGDFPAPTRPGGPVNGAYIAGSDHRKDGEAVGW